MVEFRFAKHAQSRYSQSIRRNRPATLQNPFWEKTQHGPTVDGQIQPVDIDK